MCGNIEDVEYVQKIRCSRWAKLSFRTHAYMVGKVGGFLCRMKSNYMFFVFFLSSEINWGKKVQLIC